MQRSISLMQSKPSGPGKNEYENNTLWLETRIYQTIEEGME